MSKIKGTKQPLQRGTGVHLDSNPYSKRFL